MPTTWFMAFLIMTIALQFLLPAERLIPFPYNQLGWLLILTGVALNLWTDHLFKKHNTTVKPFLNPSHFIVYGPFRISRNPMYLGMLFIIAGTAVLFKSVLLLLPAVLYIQVMNLFYISKEEAMLKKQFGSKFFEYKKKVGKWI